MAWTVTNGWLRNQLNRIFNLGTTPTAGQVLAYDDELGTYVASTPMDFGVVGGTEGQVQFNEAGNLGASSGLVFSNEALTVGDGGANNVRVGALGVQPISSNPNANLELFAKGTGYIVFNHTYQVTAYATTDPGVAGVVWADAANDYVLKVSQG